jgi:hypothetical protein
VKLVALEAGGGRSSGNGSAGRWSAGKTGDEVRRERALPEVAGRYGEASIYGRAQCLNREMRRASVYQMLKGTLLCCQAAW